MARTFGMVLGLGLAALTITGCTTNERTLAGAGIGGAGGALVGNAIGGNTASTCLLYTSPSPRD